MLELINMILLFTCISLASYCQWLEPFYSNNNSLIYVSSVVGIAGKKLTGWPENFNFFLQHPPTLISLSRNDGEELSLYILYSLIQWYVHDTARFVTDVLTRCCTFSWYICFGVLWFQLCVFSLLLSSFFLWLPWFSDTNSTAETTTTTTTTTTTPTTTTTVPITTTVVVTTGIPSPPRVLLNTWQLPQVFNNTTIFFYFYKLHGVSNVDTAHLLCNKNMRDAESIEN